MTIELVDGKAGTAHISSEDKAIIHQAKFSKSDVVFDWGDAFKCSMSSSNRATVGTGCASIQGLDWHITSAESVTISNGSQGMKRNDIICAHYNRNPKNGNELVELVVLKGSPNATAAADPTFRQGRYCPARLTRTCRCGASRLTASRSVRRYACSRRGGLCGIP
ncbi:hypothetical protein DWX12_09155 [Bifidobacterium pseudocatenulatum]|nr:hypothetical protein DWX12_09155 [Bifidobacterium pseudocatenulatum]